MGKGKRRRNDSVLASEEAFLSSNLRLPRPISFSAPPPDIWPEIEDRRESHPLQEYRPARTWTGEPAQIIPSRVKRGQSGRPLRSGRFLPFGLQFAQPKKVMICLRRKARKEVMHALKLTGKGYGRKRRNPYSGVKC